MSLVALFRRGLLRIETGLDALVENLNAMNRIVVTEGSQDPSHTHDLVEVPWRPDLGPVCQANTALGHGGLSEDNRTTIVQHQYLYRCTTCPHEVKETRCTFM